MRNCECQGLLRYTFHPLGKHPTFTPTCFTPSPLFCLIFFLSSDLGICFMWFSRRARLPERARTHRFSHFYPDCVVHFLKLVAASPVRPIWGSTREVFLHPLPPYARVVCSAMRGRKLGAFQHSFYVSGLLKYSLPWSFCDTVSSGACQLWAAYWDEGIQKEKGSKETGFLCEWKGWHMLCVRSFSYFVENTAWWINTVLFF